MWLVLGEHAHDVTTRALVMGALPGGRASPADVDALLRRADGMVGDGADLLDICEAAAATEQEELDSTIPAVEALSSRLAVPVSIGTSRAGVVAAAYAAGAVVGRDPSGFADPDYLAVSAQAGATVVAGHPAPHEPQDDDNLVSDVGGLLVARAHRAEAAGIPPERIVVDAGVDRTTTPAHARALLRSARFSCLGYPLLVSILDPTFPGDASASAAAVGVARGCRIVRTRDVRGVRRACVSVAAILEAR